MFGSLSGIVGLEYVTISTYLSSFRNQNAGTQIIDISYVTLFGQTSNYYLLPVQPINSYIDYKSLVLTFTGGNKIYDSTYVCGPIQGSISGIIGLEIVTISTFISIFQSNQAGPQLIDMSSIVITGANSKNYKILPVPAFNSYINYKNLVITFTGGSKIYDSYRNAGLSIFGTISGIVSKENISISSFIAMFQDQNAGSWFIDISNIILFGPTLNNYNLLPVASSVGIITKKSLVATFIGSNKVYDKTNISNAVLFSLSGIINQDFVYISYYTTVFKSYLAGPQFIDISFITLSGTLISNYYVLPVGPLAAYINQRPLTIIFANGQKIYDGTTTPNYLFEGTISNLIITDNVFLSNNYFAKFKDINAGPQFIDISNVTIVGPDINNYYILPVPAHSSDIFQRTLTVVFSGGEKIYDGTNKVNSLNFLINNVIKNDFITISSYYAVFLNPNVGTQFIDISNITLFGVSTNYIVQNTSRISSNIYLKNLYLIFTGGNKIYDNTLIPGNTLTCTLSGLVNNENINIVTFLSTFVSPNVGIQKITITKPVLIGSTLPNYLIQPIQDTFATIYKRPCNINFTGGNKIYDATLTPGTINSFLTNNIQNDYLVVNINIALYNTPNVGTNTITLTNVNVLGVAALNYEFIIQQTMSGIIYQRNIQAVFNGGNKVYDKKYNTGSISGFLINSIKNDDVIISEFTSFFRDYVSGVQTIDISNIILGGSTALNYYLSPVFPINANIYKSPINALFTADDRIYNGNKIPSNLNYILSPIFEDDQVYLINYFGLYSNANIGYRRIDISYSTLTGDDSFNYRLNNVSPIFANIFPKLLTLNFYGGNKIYDTTTNTTNIFYTISGIVADEYLGITFFTSQFRNPNSGIQIIDVSNVIFFGVISNYIINPISPFSSIISPKAITILFSNLNKIYDGTQNIYFNNINYKIVGLAGLDILTISSLTGLYKNYLVGQTLMDISNVILSGQSANNYYIVPIQSQLAFINPRLLTIIFSGGNKVYDGLYGTGPINYSLINVVQNEFIVVSSLISKYRNYIIGNQIIDISNISISGLTITNYYLTNQPPIIGLISRKIISVSFTGVDKIYDNTNIAYITNPIITGLVFNDINTVSISGYNSTYDDKYVQENKTIYVNNITLRGFNSDNYSVNPSLSLSNIKPLQIYLISIGVTKTYDQTTNAKLSNVYLSGNFIDDNITISSFIANYIDINSQLNKLINVTNITLNGSYAFNYFINPTTSIGNILPLYIPTYFTGVNKKFDGNTLTSAINGTISNVIYPDIIFISSYNSNFVDANVGINKTIIVYDISFSGSSSLNYKANTSYTSANITYPLSINLNLTSNNIIYKDSSNNAQITINPSWTIQPSNTINLLTGIYQNIIISNNGTIYNLINNNLVRIYTSSYLFTNLVMTDINNGFICGLSGLIINTTDGFSNINVNILNNSLNSASQINSGIAFLVGNNGTIYKTLDSGITWFTLISNTSENLNDISIINSNIAFIVGNNGILLQTTNGGTTWTQKNISTNNLNSIVMIDQYNGYIVGTSGTILRTNDGKTWINCIDSNNRNFTIYDLNSIYVLNSNDAMTVGNNGTILRSSNRGSTWFSYISGTVLKLSKLYMYNSTVITVIGDQGLILNFSLNPGGIIQLYDNTNLIIQSTLLDNTFNYLFNQLTVNNFYLYAQFLPFQPLNFSQANTPLQKLIVKPSLYYSISTLNTLYDRTNIIYSVQPIFDQSGGLFTIIDFLGSLVQQSLVTINYLTGIIQFETNINVSSYIFTVIYSLNNTANQTQYRFIVQPNIYYYNNYTSLIYNNSGSSDIPYYVQPNGTFVISDLSGKLVSNNLVTINSTNGIVNFDNLCPINNYVFLITYTLNNVSNTTQYFLNIKPYINYNPNITTLPYLTYGNSLVPNLNLPGGNFIIYDLSSNLVLLNKVTITNSGIINFNNNISPGFYSFTIIYAFNNIPNSTIYYLNASPYALYPETFRVIEYDHTIFDASSIPIYIPTGGLFTAIDISGNLLEQNLVTINSTDGQLIFNNINVNSYIFRITYLYNLATCLINYTLQIKPTIYYTINQTFVVNGNIANSIIPYVNPPNGTFTIVSTDNILTQLNLVTINYLTGIINFSNAIITNQYNFQINYTYNNITNSTNYNLQVLPYLNYSLNNLTLLYDISGNSQTPTYYPSNGIFSISGIFDSTKIKINKLGVLSFSNAINVGIYNIIVFYSINNVYNFYNYALSVQPIIIYPTNSISLLYQRSLTNTSVTPIVFQSGGQFIINDNSNNFINLVPSYVFVDGSGVIYFTPNISVALYSFTIYYTLNNLTTYTYFNLIIKPNIFYSVGNVTLLYDRLDDYFTEPANVDQSGGVFNIRLDSINGSIDNNGIINLYTLNNVGFYVVTITYTLRNSFNSTTYNITIKPNIYYTLSSIVVNYGNPHTSLAPFYIQLGGSFVITDISNSTIVSQNQARINQLGIILFNNNIDVGIYYLLINYTLNNISNTTIFNYNVKPNLNYRINKTVLLYDQSGNSINPTFSQGNGIFSIFDVSSNDIFINPESGVIYFSNNLNVGIYFFNVIYSLNYISNNFSYLLNILPTLYYTDNNNILLYDRSNPSYSAIPIYQQQYGKFSITDNLGNLVQNNLVSINSNTGIITFDAQINVGLYNFIVTYSLNNLSNTFTYNLIIIPNLIYSPESTTIIYNKSETSSIPYYNQKNGNFTIADTIGDLVSTNFISINNINGLLKFPKGIYPGNFQFLITYTLNGTFNTTYYDLYILPKINYVINIKNLNYGTEDRSILPDVTQSIGNFFIYDFSNNAVQQNAVTINSKTGLITFTNFINVGIYVLNVQYKLATVSNYFKYYLNVFPIINYYPNSKSILYNRITIENSIQPIVKQQGGNFNLYDTSGYNFVASNMVYIDTSGIINFGNYIFVGSYRFNILYSLNGLSTLTSYNLKVIPNISYKNSVISILYGQTFYSELPYFDQSGGYFTFNDISGFLISTNKVAYDISGGTFTIVKIPDVGLYNFIVAYYLNDVSNFINIVFYILPLITYNINSSSYVYKSDNFSIVPTVVQSGGIFSITGIGARGSSIDGIYIDTSLGVIEFSDVTKVDFYTLNVIYTLNSVFNSTTYYLKIIPISYYYLNSLETTYQTSVQSEAAIYDPSGGLFTVIPTITTDISAYFNTLIDISKGLISINPSSGILSFYNKLDVNKYYLTINYNYNNISNNTNFVFTMQPLLYYMPSYLLLKYKTISTSVLPYIEPPGGIISASVPSVKLIYTGISINNNTGVIRFGKVSPGIWDITVKYIVNGISTSIIYNLSVVANIQYDPPYLVIPYNSIASTTTPFSRVPKGIWTSPSSYDGFSIDSTTGILTFTKMNTGVYELSIIYTVFGTIDQADYLLIVSPSVVYTPSTTSVFYTQTSQSVIPKVNPLGGIFSANFNDENQSLLPSTINIDSISGFISTTNQLDVGTYSLLTNYTINDAVGNFIYVIYVYPNLNYPIGLTTMIYNTLIKSEQPVTNPNGGVFSTTSTFYVDASSGKIEFKNTILVGVYSIPVTYSYNKLEVTQNYSLRVLPLYYYSINSTDIVINYRGQSQIPVAKQSLGTFNFISISGTLEIPNGVSYLSNNNQYIDNGVLLNAYTGILYFGNQILVGYYDFILSYTLYNLTSTTNYSLTVRPYINYPLSNLILDYNTNAFSSIPFVDQSGGYFYFSNVGDLNSEFNKITINNNTGVINFNSGIKVGVFKIKIIYIVSQISNNTTYTLTIRPIYYYTNPQTTLYVNSIGYSDYPIVIQRGGSFSVVDNNNLNIDSVQIDIASGRITFNNISIGKYNFILSYSLNGSTITTTYNLIVAPYISYDIDTLNLFYTNNGYSQIPDVKYLGGIFSFEDITQFTIMKSKLSIDPSNGQIYFANYINTGFYSLVVNYIYKNIKTLYTYYLNVVPLIEYTISGSVLDYNHVQYKSNEPNVNPAKGLYFFADNSNNFPIKEVILDKNSGIITINKLMVGNYNFGIKYYLKQFVSANRYIVTILPTFYYSISQTTFSYSNGYVYSVVPISDPSGGVFRIINQIDQNYYIYNNGQLLFNKSTEVNNYLIILSYTYNNCISFYTYNLKVTPLFNYYENILNLFYGNNGNSSLPNTYPNSGIFTINYININNLNFLGTVNTLSGIIINLNSGQINFSNNLDVGDYLINLSYTYLNISTEFNYLLQVLSNIVYDLSGETIIYGYNYNTKQPYSDTLYGLYQIDPIYNSHGIFIDSSSGILSFNSNIPVNIYPINISYIILDIQEFISYNLIVKPNIYYDISYINIDYGNFYKSNKPFINPLGGKFKTNYGLIDASGTLILNNFSVNNYTINITYIVNNIPNNYLIGLSIYPVIYYSNISINIINTTNTSLPPFSNPNNGIFYLDISNITINSNGTINFDPTQSIGKYNISVYYMVNNLVKTTSYNYIIIPYINYFQPSISIKGGTIGNSCLPIVTPLYGKFTSTFPIDSSGIIYFNSNINIGIYNINVNYSLNDLSNNTLYILTVTPYIYYNDQIQNYNIAFQSEKPIKNANGGKFNLTYNLFSLINIAALNIDISSGIIYFKPTILVGRYFFYVNYSVNGLIYTHTYNLLINPVVIYPDFNINQFSSFKKLPTTLNPPGGIFSCSNLPSFLNFNTITGEISTNNALKIGRFILIINYVFNSITININVKVNISPLINYNNNFIITYLDRGFSDSPTVSISGGIYIGLNLPSGLAINTYSGIFSYIDAIDVANYSIKVIYLIDDVSGYTNFNLTVYPYLNYSSNTLLIYGTPGTSIQPIVNPQEGIFSLVNNYSDIVIDPNYGIINYGSTNKVNTYNILVKYTYNNIETTVNTSLIINKKILLVDFIASDKLYDGTTSVLFTSNKMIGAINNDKVFISSYNASFQNIGPGLNIPVFVYDLVLGGSDSYNYNIQYDNLATGSINLVKYNPNSIKCNQGTEGVSSYPIVSNIFNNPFYIINSITTSGSISGNITVDQFGLIKWDNLLEISIYYISVKAYNSTLSQDLTYILEITKNLFSGTLAVEPPTIPNTTIESNVYQLQYSSTTGNAFALNNDVNGLVAKFSITAYNNENNNISHDLGTSYPFVFQLANADPSANLISYELNDDGTVNYSVGYKLEYLGGINYVAHLTYLSDFYVQDLKVLSNVPPVFDPPTGNYNTPSILLVTITALPNSIIYYTIDGSEPNFTSNNYLVPLQFSFGIITLKAFAVTPGHANSEITTATYTIHQVPCILSKTLIRTPDGNEYVDNLKEGDLIITDDNRIVPIIQILKYQMNSPTESSYPVCIPKNYFGSNIPDRDTYISQNHAIKLTNEYWIYGGHHLKYFKKHIVKPLYYHILLPNYFRDNLIANNMFIESWSGLLLENSLVSYKNQTLVTFKDKEYIAFKKYIKTKNLMYKKL